MTIVMFGSNSVEMNQDDAIDMIKCLGKTGFFKGVKYKYIIEHTKHFNNKNVNTFNKLIPLFLFSQYKDDQDFIDLVKRMNDKYKNDSNLFFRLENGKIKINQNPLKNNCNKFNDEFINYDVNFLIDNVGRKCDFNINDNDWQTFETIGGLDENILNELKEWVEAMKEEIKRKYYDVSMYFYHLLNVIDTNKVNDENIYLFSEKITEKLIDDQEEGWLFFPWLGHRRITNIITETLYDLYKDDEKYLDMFNHADEYDSDRVLGIDENTGKFIYQPEDKYQVMCDVDHAFFFYDEMKWVKRFLENYKKWIETSSKNAPTITKCFKKYNNIFLQYLAIDLLNYDRNFDYYYQNFNFGYHYDEDEDEIEIEEKSFDEIHGVEFIKLTLCLLKNDKKGFGMDLGLV